MPRCQKWRKTALLAAPLLTLLSLLALAGCSSEEPVDTSSGQYGKVGTETTLPPQGKPPAPGEDVSARAQKAAGAR